MNGKRGSSMIFKTRTLFKIVILLGMLITLGSCSTISTPNNSTSSSSETKTLPLASDVHPVFDIAEFDSSTFTDTTDLFSFNLEVAVTKGDEKIDLFYTLTITPTNDEIYNDVTVTASLNEKLLEILVDQHRNFLYFGTDKANPIIMDKNSESYKGLIADKTIHKAVAGNLTDQQLLPYLKSPLKVKIKYSEKIINLMVVPTTIFIYGEKMSF